MTEGLRATIAIQENVAPRIETSSPVALAEDLTAVFGDTKALNKLSVGFYAGEIVAIMGRNGAGKSTFLKSLAGIPSAITGKIRVLNHDPRELSGRNRTSLIGYIPQEPSDLLYCQSVEQECQNADKDNEVLPGTTFNLLNQLVPGVSPKTHPRDLSEGQRLGLAMSVVLSANPSVLILDEPTRGLDYSAKSSLISIIRSVAIGQNKLVILATHDVELVGEVATRTLFLSDGEIVADGPTVEVLLSSPAFAPQIAKIMSPVPWLSINDVLNGIEPTT
jgi:energy-coupling factor transport system ATP-binding protein